jgi:hypothetical protein
MGFEKVAEIGGQAMTTVGLILDRPPFVRRETSLRASPLAQRASAVICDHPRMEDGVQDHETTPALSGVEPLIRVVRGQRVMLDSDLAALYGVETRILTQAVLRNAARFPADFMFQLTEKEFESLRSQTVTSNGGRGGRRYRPHVFTEQGVAMLSSVLRSDRAVQVNIEIMRAFVRLRQLLSSNAELSQRLDDMEQRYDEHIRRIIEAINRLMAPSSSSRRQIGFRP